MPRRPVSELEERIGYTFQNQDLLLAALAHTTYLNENPAPGEERVTRLAFLGDAVVELAVRAAVMTHLRNEPKGVLSKAADGVVPDETLANVARRIELGEWLDLGVGEQRAGGRDNTTILADALEAIAGAIYLDDADKGHALNIVTELIQPLVHIDTAGRIAGL